MDHTYILYMYIFMKMTGAQRNTGIPLCSNSWGTIEYLANIYFLKISGYDKYKLVEYFTVLICGRLWVNNLTEKLEFVTSHVWVVDLR